MRPKRNVDTNLVLRKPASESTGGGDEYLRGAMIWPKPTKAVAGVSAMTD